MRHRIVWISIGCVLLCVLALVGTGLIFAAMSRGGGIGSQAQTSTSQNKSVFNVTQVYMRNDAFTPAHIEVLLGATVTWTNQDTVPHNVTLTPAVLTASNNWESGLIYPGQSFSYTFTSRGSFQYYCQEHPSEMIGTVLVT
jgi:plastocyanin